MAPRARNYHLATQRTHPTPIANLPPLWHTVGVGDDSLSKVSS